MDVDRIVDIRLKRDPERLNPVIYPSSDAREVFQYIFLPLADFDPSSLKLRPILIKSIPIPMKIKEGNHEGGISIEYEILEEATWPDGNPITGYDYAFVMKTVNHKGVNAAAYRTYLQEITDILIDTINSKKFTVIIGRDYMLALEATATLQVYPEHIYDPQFSLRKYSIESLKREDNKLLEQDTSASRFVSNFNGNKFSREVVIGSGPYALDSWTSNQSITLKRIENYWAQGSENPFLQAFPDDIRFHISPDEMTSITLLKSGELDLVSGINSHSFKELERNDSIDNFDFFSPQLMRYYYIGINNRDSRLSDRNVRKALAHLTNVDLMIDNLEEGLGTRVIGHFHPQKPYYHQELEPLRFDEIEARKLLSASGWEDSDGNGILDKIIEGNLQELNFEILVSPGKLGKNVALLLQQNAEKLGIKINVIQKEFKLIRKDHLARRKFDLVTLVHTADANTDDPYNKWHSDNLGPGGRNEIGYSSPRADRLIEAIRDERNREKQTSLFKELQEVIYEDCPVVFLWSPMEKIVLRSAFEGSTTSKRPGYLANTFRSLSN